MTRLRAAPACASISAQVISKQWHTGRSGLRDVYAIETQVTAHQCACILTGVNHVTIRIGAKEIPLLGQAALPRPAYLMQHRVPRDRPVPFAIDRATGTARCRRLVTGVTFCMHMLRLCWLQPTLSHAGRILTAWANAAEHARAHAVQQTWHPPALADTPEYGS